MEADRKVGADSHRRPPGAPPDAQVLKDAGRLIAAWNKRQAKRMPMLFSPTIGAAVASGIGFCGSVRLIERSMQLTCDGSTVTATPR
jgi:hypothetical protein